MTLAVDEGARVEAVITRLESAIVKAKVALDERRAYDAAAKRAALKARKPVAQDAAPPLGLFIQGYNRI